MDPKYSNIFWHQGVKVFEDGILNSQKGQVKVAHLENDVTKAMLNLFEHCSSKVLNAFLQMIGIKQAPGAFNLEFQVTDTESLRSKPVRIMLCIISASTGRGSSSSYCMSSKGFGQIRHRNKRGFQVPNTLFQMFKQPLMSNYTSYAGALYFS